MKAAKQGISFAIYAIPTSKQVTTTKNILKQYREFQARFQDVFEKKIVNILS